LIAILIILTIHLAHAAAAPATLPTTRLSGDLIGTPGSWQSKGNTIAKAVDGIKGDYFDAPTADGAWVGYDLHSQFLPGAVSFAPRPGFSQRMAGGIFQGANSPDFSDAITLLKIDSPPAAFGVYSLTSTAPVRYVRYLSPAGGFCNISLLSFSGSPFIQVTPSVIGINAAGVSDPLIDLSTHPQYLSFCKAAGITRLRVWTEGTFKTHQPASYYHYLPAWNQAGVKVILVANFQNSTPRGSAPSDADWSGWCSAIPPPSITGAAYVEIGNEVNTGTYYTGNVQQLAHLMEVAYPILHAKGYLVIAPSTLNSLSWVTNLQTLGAYKFCDFVNIHSYVGSAEQVAAAAHAAELVATAVGKPLAMTEWGTRPASKSPPIWAAEQVKAIGLLRQRPIMSLSFPLYFLPGDPSDAASPFDEKGAVQQPYHDVMMGAALKSGNQ
jgi:hypothetical protein